MSSTSSMLLPFSLLEDQKCKGHENYANWKINMIVHGRPRGLLNYWEDKIFVSGELLSQPLPGQSTQSSLPLQTTPVHSRIPNELEYKLHESVALLSILINLTDIARLGVNSNGTSYEAWKFLEKQYGAGSQRMRNMKERELADWRYIDGSKVTSAGGHIEKMQKLWKAMNDTSLDISDDRFIVKLLSAFPDESWDSMMSMMYEETDLIRVMQTA